MSLINTIEDELGQSALYLLPIVVALVVMVLVLFGCLVLLKYKRKKVSIKFTERKKYCFKQRHADISVSLHFPC